MTTTATDPTTEPSRYIGPEAADELNRAHPCDVPWCDHECSWRADIVGGKITCYHRRNWSTGIHMSQLEFAPDFMRRFDGPVGLKLPDEVSPMSRSPEFDDDECGWAGPTG